MLTAPTPDLMAPLTIAAAARHCGVARRTLQRAIKAGRLALTPDHQLTLEALQQAGYVAATLPQGPTAATPQGDTSQALPQALTQALSPLLERLDRVITLLEALPSAAATPQAAPRRRTAATPQDPVLAQILRWRQEGMSLQAIAARLNAEGVPTRSGKGQWYQSNLSRMLKRVGRGQYAGV
jgi:hypothetical protein